MRCDSSNCSAAKLVFNGRKAEKRLLLLLNPTHVSPYPQPQTQPAPAQPPVVASGGGEHGGRNPEESQPPVRACAPSHTPAPLRAAAPPLPQFPLTPGAAEAATAHGRSRETPRPPLTAGGGLKPPPSISTHSPASCFTRLYLLGQSCPPPATFLPSPRAPGHHGICSPTAAQDEVMGELRLSLPRHAGSCSPVPALRTALRRRGVPLGHAGSCSPRPAALPVTLGRGELQVPGSHSCSRWELGC